MTILKLTDIYKSLSQLGLKKAQVRALLPEWWDDETAKSEIGIWEFVLLVARRLSIDAQALAYGEIKPIGSVSKIAFKHRRTEVSEAYRSTSMIAASLADAISAATIRPYTHIDISAAQLREQIRAENQGIVDFDGLLNFCWQMGIPVIPLPNLPIGLKKMDGAIFHIGPRPAIVISRKNDSKSWLSFILAHEIGHLYCGHLHLGGSIIDADLKGDITAQVESPHDADEREADEFALELLGGDRAEAIVKSWHYRAPGVTIAVNARNQSAEAGSSAGHLVLRHAFNTKRWAEAQAALKFLDEDFDAQSYIVSVLREQINLDLIADDLQDLVSSITGLAHAK